MTVMDQLHVEKLHPLFVAEVTGIDVTQPQSARTLKKLWAAFNEHQILVFRDQRVDDDSQLEFTRNFGALEMTDKHAANNFTASPISRLTNIEPNGQLMPVDDIRVQQRMRTEKWHTDSSFKRIPALASLLSGRVIPPEGGNTEFASQRAAYAALPEARREQVETLVAIHDVATVREHVKEGMFDKDQKKRLPPVEQPVVRVNPVNGLKNLFVGAHAKMIVGMDEEKGKALLDELTDFCTQPQFVYSHKWRPFDLVMWDNRCTLHRATTFDKSKYGRTVHRSTVAGNAAVL
ncbi:MAG TPA: TauD/TfdA family dioxygenase [Bauldia sp.]|nr:TauD/TfdA family dioxygenase [Bauldia sp.]